MDTSYPRYSYSYPDTSYPRYASYTYPDTSYPRYNSYIPADTSYPRYSSSPSYNSSPISVSSGTSYVPTSIKNTNTNNNVNTNTNTNTNINNINVSATAVAIAPAPVQPTYSYAPAYFQSYTPAYYSAPYCTISISNYGYYGGQTLTWSSANATAASISPWIGSIPVSGSRAVSSYGQTYTMTVWGPGGTATCSTQTYAPLYAPYTSSFVAPSSYVSLAQIPYTGF